MSPLNRTHHGHAPHAEIRDANHLLAASDSRAISDIDWIRNQLGRSEELKKSDERFLNLDTEKLFEFLFRKDGHAKDLGLVVF
jgi:hypothetical protein